MWKQLLNSLILCCSKVNVKSECCSNQEIDKEKIKIKKGFFCSVSRYSSKSNLHLPALTSSIENVD